MQVTIPSKVIVLRDFLELGESPQHSMYPYEAYQSISEVVDARQRPGEAGFPPGSSRVPFFK